jgi:hypothetical protein
MAIVPKAKCRARSVAGKAETGKLSIKGEQREILDCYIKILLFAYKLYIQISSIEEYNYFPMVNMALQSAP